MAFPTTSILDDFNRADENPLAGGWSSGPVWYGDPLHKLVSNQAAAVTGGPFHDAVWGTTFAADQEIYVTVATVTNLTSIALYARLTGENTSGYTNAYFSVDFNNSTGNVSLQHYDGSETVLDTANISGGLASGDSIGMECIGTSIKVYHKPSAGSWTEICSGTSSAQNVSGKLGITTDSSLGLYRLEDFGGGEVVGGGGPARRIFLIG